MAIGIAGDAPVMAATPTENLMAIELRVQSLLIQTLLGNGTATLDDLRVLRNDVAFELNNNSPQTVPGN